MSAAAASSASSDPHSRSDRSSPGAQSTHTDASATRLPPRSSALRRGSACKDRRRGRRDRSSV
eukprot:2527981-Pleurochrysis_carterae.AAC.1